LQSEKTSGRVYGITGLNKKFQMAGLPNFNQQNFYAVIKYRPLNF